jgi:hypothetical protein
MSGRDSSADAGSESKAAGASGSMTQEEKDAICKVVCAKYTTPGMHSLLCPHTWDRWKAGQREEYGNQRSH